MHALVCQIKCNSKTTILLEDDTQDQLNEALAGSKKLDFLTTRAKKRTGAQGVLTRRSPFLILQDCIVGHSCIQPMAVYLGWLVVADLFCLARHSPTTKPPKPFAVRCAAVKLPRQISPRPFLRL